MNSMPPIADLDLRRATLCQLLHWLASGRVQPQALSDVYLQARLNGSIRSSMPTSICVGPVAGSGAHGRPPSS
jgi:hypothetical protein